MPNEETMRLIREMSALLQKRAATPADAGGGAPMDPNMMAAMGGGGGMPMDPSMMGGAPPMDPNMMAAMGGGMPMDPAMMGGGMPMDPAMMGGAPPADPAAADPAVADPTATDPAAAPTTKKQKPEEYLSNINTYLYDILVALVSHIKQSGHELPVEMLIPPPNGDSSNVSAALQQVLSKEPAEESPAGGAMAEALPEDMGAIVPKEASFRSKRASAFLDKLLGSKIPTTQRFLSKIR